MTIEKAIEMIEEYLLEPNNIDKSWVEVLEMCKQALLGKAWGKDFLANESGIRRDAIEEFSKRWHEKLLVAKAQLIRIDELSRLSFELASEVTNIVLDEMVGEIKW